MTKDTFFQKKKRFVIRGKCVDLSTPLVMGIINLTPDSFYEGSRFSDLKGILSASEKMISDGAAILDLGAASTRPGSRPVPPETELERLLPVLSALRREFPELYISVDTYWSKVAKGAVDSGADLINDISGGELDPEMFETVGKLGVPYILMHMQGQPSDMQVQPEYADVTKEVLYYLSARLKAAHEAGIRDIIIDPGFGFGKTVVHNYTLLARMKELSWLGCPVLAGVSRKSMINKVLDTPPSQALNGTTALHMLALKNGADFLRVHDVREAVEAVKIWKAFADCSTED